MGCIYECQNTIQFLVSDQSDTCQSCTFLCQNRTRLGTLTGTASKTSRHFYLQTFFLIRAFENALKRKIQSPFWSGRVPP